MYPGLHVKAFCTFIVKMKPPVARLWYLFLLVFTGLVILLALHMSGYAPSIKAIKRIQFIEHHILSPFRGNDSKHFLHLIAVFPLLETEEWFESRYSHITQRRRELREKEYIFCLKKNLDHPAVARVHLLSHRPKQLFLKLARQYDVDMSKVILHNSTANPTYEEIFEYASRVLQGRFVMIINADNYMGDGFSDFDLAYLRTSKVMYSLTRRFPVPLPANCSANVGGHCEDKSQYMGSHDAFIFFLTSPFPQTFLKELRFPSHVFGSENVVIWAFQNILNFSVLNPCKKVHIHHFHCSQVRAGSRVRVNKNGKSGVVGFSNSLYVKD